MRLSHFVAGLNFFELGTQNVPILKGVQNLGTFYIQNNYQKVAPILSSNLAEVHNVDILC